MSDTTANLWLLDEPKPRTRVWRPKPLATGLLVGLLVGSVLTALAIGPLQAALADEPAVAAREWPKRALDREWRGYRTPVDPSRMFRRAR